MTIPDLKAWLAQPSTILGFGMAGATISGIVAHLATGSLTWTAGAAGIAGALIHIVMPDNSAAQTSIERLATDAITAIVQKKLTLALPTLFADAVAVEQAVTVTTTPVAAPVAAPIPVAVIAAPAVA